ncbi:MAG: protease-4 [Algoriphagus sp.]
MKAGEDYRVVYYPEVKPWFETIMDDFGQSVRVGFLKHELQENYKIYQQVEKLKTYQGIQARMAQEITIK